MLASEAEYDVYRSPRIHPVQFGDYVAGEGRERERILQSAKFYKRAPRARAWFARQAVTQYLTSAARSIGHLDAALTEAKSDSANPALSDQKRADATASAENLSGFVSTLNQLKFTGKDIFAIEGEQKPMLFEGVSIQADLACLISSFSKSDTKRIGALFLNTHTGSGLGSKEDTKKKRFKAGETVSILVLKRVINEFSDYGEPYAEDCMHMYARAKHFWCAPKAYINKLGNMEAEARSVARAWDTITPPSDFSEARANFHD